MKTKADYNLALQVVSALVCDWDPYSLFACGCPADEFDSEVASVVAQIPRIKSEKDAMLVLSRVFSSAFDREQFTPDACEAVGKKLFASLSDQGLLG